MPTSIEFHLSISPTIEMLTMARVFDATLARFGGMGRRARVVVTVGADQVPDDLPTRLPWADPDRIEFRRCPEDLYARRGIWGTVTRRLQYDHSADVAVLADADLVVTGRMDDLANRVRAEPAITGLIAHATPFRDGGDRWDDIFAAAGLGPPERTHQYTGWPYMAWQRDGGWQAAEEPPHRWAPPYFNHGFVAAPGALLNAVGRVYEHMLDAAAAVVDTVFVGQIALTLAIVHLDLPRAELPMRYNFGNDPRLEALHPDELRDVRAVHVLRRHQGVEKKELYAGIDRIKELVARTSLWGANEAMRRSLGAVLPELETAPTVLGEVGTTRWW